MDVGKGLEWSIRPYPDLETGLRAADMKYRFQWNAPILISPHNPDEIYVTSQVVHRSLDGGVTWDVISPDLTRNDKSKQDYSGGEGITRDSTGVEVYDTIFAFEESPKVAGELWAGSDDGLMHLSRDAGKTWQDITPKDLPAFSTINTIDLSPNDPAQAIIAAYRYRQNDFTPYAYKTTDYGKTWRRIATGTDGIPKNYPVRVVREDPARKGLLYAGTEYGLFVSFDDGARLAVAPAEPARHARHRPEGLPRQPDRVDPGAGVLRPRRPRAAAPGEAGDGEDEHALQAAGRLPVAGRSRPRSTTTCPRPRRAR